MASCASNCAGLQARLDAREPRAEDLATIEQLLRHLREKDEIVRRTYEEMKYFKLELQNCEENFNKNFGGGPRVGVMMPTASKGSGAPDKLRSGVVQAAAMNMGVNASLAGSAAASAAGSSAGSSAGSAAAAWAAAPRLASRQRLWQADDAASAAPLLRTLRRRRLPRPSPPIRSTFCRPPDTPTARQGWEENKTQGPGGPKRESRERRPIASAGSQLGL